MSMSIVKVQMLPQVFDQHISLYKFLALTVDQRQDLHEGPAHGSAYIRDTMNPYPTIYENIWLNSYS